MTDEVSQPVPPASESTPTPQPAEPVAAVPAPTPEPPTPTEPVVSPEAVKEISQVITEGLQESLTPESATPPPAEPEAPEIEVLEPSKIQTPPAPAPAPAPAPQPAPPTQKPSAGAHMRQVVRSRKQARLEKVMEMASQKRVIVNGDVQKLLNVSDPTATNYLRELVRAGRLKKNGVRAGTRYEAL